MLKILRAHGSPKPIVAVIGLLYTGAFFEISTGVLQGDTLAPYFSPSCWTTPRDKLLEMVLRK